MRAFIVAAYAAAILVVVGLWSSGWSRITARSSATLAELEARGSRKPGNAA